MDFELISEEEFEGLPDDDEQCFVAYEAICRRNMNRMISDDSRGHFERHIQSQYMAGVASVAEECGIPNIPRGSYDPEHFSEIFGDFSLAVHGEIARIRVRGRHAMRSYSVQLTPKTKITIEHYIARIRETIKKSSLPDNRQKALNKKLDLLMAELEHRRLNFGPTLAVLNTVLIGLASVTTIGSEGPAAVTHIMKLIGADKETEDAAALRLAPPPKALPAPPVKPVAPMKTTVVSSTTDLEDEIPF